MEPHLVTIEDAARALGIGRSKFYQLVAGGDIAVVRIGRAVRVPTAELTEWVRTNTTSAKGGQTSR